MIVPVTDHAIRMWDSLFTLRGLLPIRTRAPHPRYHVNALVCWQDPLLRHIEVFGYERLLGDGLMILALVKAVAYNILNVLQNLF